MKKDFFKDSKIKFPAYEPWISDDDKKIINLTLSQSMLSIFRGINQNAIMFDLQHGIIHNNKENDLNSKQRMFRLIQGDVGTGKTIVALLVISDFVNAGFQAVLMAPTELLANQHYQYFKELLPKKIKIELLTGNVKYKDKISIRALEVTNIHKEEDKTTIIIKTKRTHKEKSYK